MSLWSGFRRVHGEAVRSFSCTRGGLYDGKRLFKQETNMRYQKCIRMKFRVVAMVLCGVACAAADVMDSTDKALPLPGDRRAELARELFEPLSFNLGDYFFVQEDLKKYISELSVRNAAWDELKRYHDNHDYLGMLGVLSGEKLRDYPSEETIRRLHTILVESPILASIVRFQLSVSLTRKINIVCRAFPGKDAGIFLGTDFQNMNWQFKIKGGKCFYIYSPDNRINAIIKQYGDARDKVREDMKMARIFKDDGEKKIAGLCERQYNDTLRWLATAKVVAGEPIAGRTPLLPSFWKSFNGGQKKVSVNGLAVQNGASDSDKAKTDTADNFAVCAVCNGKKTVSEEMICSRCNGVGSVVRQSKIKDLSGNALPAKETKCTKCNGKGIIIVGRKPCETCGGKGRLPK